MKAKLSLHPSQLPGSNFGGRTKITFNTELIPVAMMMSLVVLGLLVVFFTFVVGPLYYLFN